MLPDSKLIAALSNPILLSGLSAPLIFNEKRDAMSDEEELMRKFRDHWSSEEGCSLRTLAEIARDHFAANPPAMAPMSDETRSHKIHAFFMCVHWEGTIEDAESALAEHGFISAKPAPTMGERFAKDFGSRVPTQFNSVCEKLLAKLIEERFGQACKSTAEGEHSMEKSVGLANQAANLEAKLRGEG